MLFFDTETFSELDVNKVGSAKYARHPSTRILMITWCYDTGAAHICEPEIEPIPDDLLMSLSNPRVKKCTANVGFDRDIIQEKLGIQMPLSSFVDLFALAYSLGFTGSLEKIGEQIGVSEDKAKLKEGKKLIHRFCKPQPSNHKVRLRTRETDPIDWERFRQYALRDTESLREQWNILTVHNSMSDKEWHYWRLTMEMNERGIPVDRDLVHTALKLVAERKRQIKNELIELTGLENPNSNQQLLPWLAQFGYNLPNMQAATVDKLIPNVKNELVKTVLIKKRALGQTAPTKWKAFDTMACDDNLVRGVITYRGAARTGRDASRGVNFQNLKRPPEGDMDDHVKVIQTNDLEFIKLIHGEPLDFLSKTVRAAVTAPEGYMLSVSDLSSIESRIIGWLTGCKRMMQVFAEGKDTYKDFAMELYNIPYDQVTKKQRTFAKPPVLGAGYMLSANGLVAYADNMGVTMTYDDASHAVNKFRNIYHEIPKFWGDIISAIERVIRSKNPEILYRMHIRYENDFLFIRLPSGRDIAYHRPMFSMWDTPIGVKPTFTYMGINRYTLKWERVAAHAGGVTENLVQALARDVMMEWVDRLPTLDIRLRVHDELVAVTPEPYAKQWVEHMNEVIRQPIGWAPGLLLNAEGGVSKHYGKG